MNICVYGSASRNIAPAYVEFARKLGEELAKRGHRLVFGGSDCGLMGAAAQGVYEQGGEILGIAPEFFDEDGSRFAHCTDFIETENVSERKTLFQINADAFFILPGGLGTFDEFFETIENKSIGHLDKPVILINVNGYYDKLVELLEYSEQEQFVRVSNKGLYQCASTVEEVFERLEEN